MPRINYVSTNGPGGPAQAVNQLGAEASDYGYVEIGSDGLTPPGSFPFRIDQSGNIVGASINALSPVAPAVATAETVPRWAVTANTAAATSGTLAMMAIPIAANVPINNITLMVDATAAVTVTHGWYVLCDSNRVVRAVSADQASGWGAASTPVPLAVSPYTTTYSGLYYVGYCISAATMPTFAGSGSMRNPVYSSAPILCGNSNAGMTTPPAVGTTMNAITGSGIRPFYAYTS